jgi:hypothetical protein
MRKDERVHLLQPAAETFERVGRVVAGSTRRGRGTFCPTTAEAAFDDRREAAPRTQRQLVASAIRFFSPAGTAAPRGPRDDAEHGALSAGMPRRRRRGRPGSPGAWRIVWALAGDCRAPPLHVKAFSARNSRAPGHRRSRSSGGIQAPLRLRPEPARLEHHPPDAVFVSHAHPDHAWGPMRERTPVHSSAITHAITKDLPIGNRVTPGTGEVGDRGPSA